MTDVIDKVAARAKSGHSEEDEANDTAMPNLHRPCDDAAAPVE